MTKPPIQTQSLLELAERAEQATGPDRELDCRIWAAIRGNTFDLLQSIVPNLNEWQAPAYSASIDAAMSLVPEGHDWDCSKANGLSGASVWPTGADRHDSVLAATPALALCAASLRAKSLAEADNG